MRVEILRARTRPCPRSWSPMSGGVSTITALMKGVEAAKSEAILSAAHDYLASDPRVLADKQGVFANQDQAITPARVDEFTAGLKDAGKSIELHRYDAHHGFANPSSAKYDHAAASEAWAHVRVFLVRQLRGE